MVFELSIDIEENVTRKDIAMVLRRTADRIARLNHEPFAEGDGAPIRDLDGAKIGEWNVR